MKLNGLTLFALIALGLSSGCNYSIDKVGRDSRSGSKETAPQDGSQVPEDGEGAQAPKFSEIHPVLIAQCLGCHSDSRRVASLSVQTWQALVENPRAIVPGDPENSGIYASVTDDYMPDASYVSRGLARPLTASEKEALRLWILAGARND